MDITLYKPDGIVKYPGVTTYGLKDGVLTFRTEKDPSSTVTEIRTTVHFLIEAQLDVTKPF